MEIAESLKFTVITVCKNSERFLNETIESVLNQSYPNIEYLIIDGQSTDGTLEIIRKHSSGISNWLSEEDHGMYDAINKGLKLSTGDYILILNSDDVLADKDVLSKVAKQIGEERMDYYYGNLIKLKEGKCKKVKLFPVTFQQLLLSTHGTFAPHPCFFISSKLNKKIGGYDQKYKYASDYHYILRALFNEGTKGKYLNIYITKFRIHDNSITASGKIDSERKKILTQYGYFQQPYLKRVFSYYTLWIYYKIINIGRGFRNSQD